MSHFLVLRHSFFVGFLFYLSFSSFSISIFVAEKKCERSEWVSQPVKK